MGDKSPESVRLSVHRHSQSRGNIKRNDIPAFTFTCRFHWVDSCFPTTGMKAILISWLPEWDVSNCRQSASFRRNKSEDNFPFLCLQNNGDPEVTVPLKDFSPSILSFTTWYGNKSIPENCIIVWQRNWPDVSIAYCPCVPVLSDISRSSC